MDGCSDVNRTDCLLEAVLEAIKDHNRWDVPTISVTSVIGVVALTFAAMTVIQGVLSAGPGQRKCSKAAIGNWSKNTKRRWNWSQLRRDSLAYTPVLTSRNLIEAIFPVPEKSYNRQNKEGRTVANFPATWMNLLKYTNMDQFVRDEFQTQTKQTAADYLPSEVQAVPAFMDIHSIVCLAAIAGCDSLTIEPGSGYPLITGSGIQVHFRRDPFLGLVASFERYDESKENTSTIRDADLSQEDLIQFGNLLTAVGRFPRLSIDFYEGIQVVQHVCYRQPLCILNGHYRLLLGTVKRDNLTWLLYAGVWSFMDIFAAKSARIEGLLGTIVVQGSYWSKSDLYKQHIFSKLNQESRDWDDFWPEVERYMGGCDVTGTRWVLFALCLQFAVDARVGQRVFRRFARSSKMQLRSTLRNEIIAIDDETNPNQYRINSRHDIGLQKIPVKFDDAIRRGLECTRAELYMTSAVLMDLALYQGVLTTTSPSSSKRPQDAEDLEDSLNQGRKSELEFETARNFLRAINTRKASVSVAIRRIFNGATSDEIDILCKSLGELAQQLEGSRDPLKRPSPESIAEFESPIHLMKEQDDPMLELLIYRSILMAIHSLTSLDNSDILDSGIGNQIVPFL